MPYSTEAGSAERCFTEREQRPTTLMVHDSLMAQTTGYRRFRAWPSSQETFLLTHIILKEVIRPTSRVAQHVLLMTPTTSHYNNRLTGTNLNRRDNLVTMPQDREVFRVNNIKCRYCQLIIEDESYTNVQNRALM